MHSVVLARDYLGLAAVDAAENLDVFGSSPRAVAHSAATGEALAYLALADRRVILFLVRHSSGLIG
jgi:hypothetical protein